MLTRNSRGSFLFMADDIHIGQEIKKVLGEKHISAAKFAEMIHCSRRNAYDIFSNGSMDIKRLKHISELLDYDFVALFVQDNSISEKKTFHLKVIVENGKIKVDEE